MSKIVQACMTCQGSGTVRVIDQFGRWSLKTCMVCTGCGKQPPLQLPQAKRCASCKRSRSEGAHINRGQGYCRDCFTTYMAKYRAPARQQA